MRRKLSMTMLITLMMTAIAIGNSGPAPLPKDHKVAEPPLRFEGIDQYPDQVFCLNYSVVYLGQTWVEVKDSAPIKLTFKFKDRVPSISVMTLFAMDRKAFDKQKTDDPSLKWLNPKTEGVLSVKLTPPETTVPLKVKEIPVLTWKVAIEDGKLTAEKVEDKKCDEEPTGLLPTWAFGVAGSVSIAWFGVWFVRREPRHVALMP